jgi:hypothetical protein
VFKISSTCPTEFFNITDPKSTSASPPENNWGLEATTKTGKDTARWVLSTTVILDLITEFLEEA